MCRLSLCMNLVCLFSTSLSLACVHQTMRYLKLPYTPSSLSRRLRTFLNPQKHRSILGSTIHRTIMADPDLWKLYYCLFNPPEDPKAKEVYAQLNLNTREHFRRQYQAERRLITVEIHRKRLWQAYRSLFHRRRRNQKSWRPRQLPETLKDPYVLAYKYRQFMDERAGHRCVGPAWRESANPYYENLLANQEEPPVDATDNLSRAIRYAKKHHECFYDKSQVGMIIGILDKQNVSTQPSLEDQTRVRLGLLYNTARLAKKSDEYVE
jgi:hypothetical protein